jgi:autotransporter family porin
MVNKRTGSGAPRAPRRLAAVLILATLSVPGVAGPAQAQSITFSGNFNDFVSTPQVPVPTTNVTPAFTANAGNGGPNVTIGTAINVGDSARGTVLIEGGAQLNVTGFNAGCLSPGTSCIGNQTGSVGEVTVKGPGSAYLPQPGFPNFVVGASGTGSLTIEDGGRFTAGNNLFLGTAGGAGTVIVNGPTSSLFTISSLVVGPGLGSTGTLIIENGANVTNALSFVAGGFGGGGMIAGLGTSMVRIETGGVLTSNSFAVIGTTPPRPPR